MKKEADHNSNSPLGPTGTLSLIGMPGSGKSSVGVLLAKALGTRFVDTDLDIQVHEQCTLQTTLEQKGYQHLRAVEQQVLLSIALDNAVIATGGSVVYSEDAMRRLGAAGPLIYLQASQDCLRERIAKDPLRGIASPPEQSFADIYAEREPLYRRWSDLTVDVENLSPESVAQRIVTWLVTDQD